jgi:hypothetical protein
VPELIEGSGCFIRHARGACAGLDPVAGIQFTRYLIFWIPAFAGMTVCISENSPTAQLISRPSSLCRVSTFVKTSARQAAAAGPSSLCRATPRQAPRARPPRLSPPQADDGGQGTHADLPSLKLRQGWQSQEELFLTLTINLDFLFHPLLKMPGTGEYM